MKEEFDVTFLIGSVTSDRPPEQFVLKTIDNINEISKNSKYTYEILIISEHKVAGDNVRWIEESPEIRSWGGAARAYNALIPHAKGKYLAFGVDDCTYDDQFYTAIDLLESYVYNNRTLKMLLLCSDNGLGAFMPPGYPHYTVARFPIIKRESLTNYFNGKWFNPEFHHHYADNWLGYWALHTFGETIIEVYNTTIHIPEGAPSYNHDNTHDEKVFHQLVKRFHEGYRFYV
tara:strand:+ start:1226 stop:1918 length:693 start_codon:yes stop_codon:yes gene_type:complete